MNKQIRNIVLPFLLVTVLVFSLTGCNTTKESSSYNSHSSSSDSSEVIDYKVVFNINNNSDTDTSIMVVAGEKVARPTDPIRTGYIFDNWYTSIALAEPFDFSKPIVEDITIYAGWLEEGAIYYDVTYHFNYEGAPEDLVQRVKVGDFAKVPLAPVRDGFDFCDWYKQAECYNKYYFSSAVVSDVELYAYWNKIFVFEAENIDVSELEGPGYSGGATGADMILEDLNGKMGASGGYYVSYLYRSGICLEFSIISSKAVTNAHLYASLSSEQNNTTITSTTYLFTVNGTSLAYSDITFTDVPYALSPDRKPFEKYLISLNVNLKEGVNTIILMANNDDRMGGTMAATAPMVDCLLISSASELSWNEELGFPFINK